MIIIIIRPYLDYSDVIHDKIFNESRINGKFSIQLVKCTRGRSSNFTDLVKSHYVIKTHVAIE